METIDILKVVRSDNDTVSTGWVKVDRHCFEYLRPVSSFFRKCWTTAKTEEVRRGKS